ncbi:MAG TPA: DUF3808 domain-containing protein [Desulfobulbus sp.]|nr:DUF3808 domain-containing protein [Desulfobulbus sp.]
MKKNGFLFCKKSLCLLLLTAQLCLPLQAGAMSIGEERTISEQLLYSVRAQFHLLDAPDISQYINDLGYQVLKVAGPQYFNYHFFVVKSNEFNAFAAPGGLVFFYSGLIRTMKTENELVSVLAHEIGHVVSRHIAQRVAKSGKISALTMGLGLAALALGKPELLIGSMAAGQAMNLHYSRQDEEEADRLSFGWMKDMHRNPIAMEDMLRTMRRITRYRSDKLPQYLLTHPNPEARSNYVESLIEIDDKQKVPGYYKKTDNFRFLRFKYRVMLQSMDLEQMRIDCTNLVTSSKDPEQRIMAQYGLALIARENHNFSRAAELLKKVEARYPDRDILEVDTAVLKMAAGRVGEAVDLLQHAVKRDPTDMYAVFELAKARIQQKEYARAEKLLQQVARAMPEYSQMYYEIARVKADQGLNNESRFYLGKYSLYEGRMKQAKQYFTRAKNDTTLPEPLRNEASAILERLKKLEES